VVDVVVVDLVGALDPQATSARQMLCLHIATKITRLDR
jgi:hypothetical protein